MKQFIPFTALTLLLVLSCKSATDSDDTSSESGDTLRLYSFGAATSTTEFSTYVDDGGKSTVSFTVDTEATNPVATVSYTLDKGSYQWDPFVNLQVKPNGSQPYDASAYDGVSYRYKGDAQPLIVILS